MKTKHLFLSALTCLAFAACSNDDDAVQNPQSENGDKAYIAINFSMPGSGATTRWADDELSGNYETAKPYEVDVDKIAFFFFKSNNDQAAVPCIVDVDDNTIWEGVNDNHSGENGNDTDDRTTKVVLTVKNPDQVSKVVAVLNPTTQISNLAANAHTIQSDGETYYDPANTTEPVGSTNLETLGKYFLSSVVSGGEASTPVIELDGSDEEQLKSDSPKLLMSNSVYYEPGDAGALVQATPITANNLRTTVASAKSAPVTIHVERIWARVKVALGNGSDLPSGIYKATQKDGDATTDIKLGDDQLYIQLGDWWLNNTNKDAYIIKQYTSKPNYSWLWNDPADYRSYWANAYKGNESSYTSEDFKHYSYESATSMDKYCLENTSVGSFTQSNIPDETFTTSTQVVIAAKVGTYNTTSGFTATPVVEYAGVLYAIDGFKGLMLSGDNLKTVYKKTSDTEYETVGVDDLEFVYNTNENTVTGLRDFQAYLQLKTKDSDNNDITYYKSASSDDKYSSAEITNINATLDDAIVKYWNNGQCYFFTKIKHHDSTNLYAVIRNHLYKVSVTGVSGLGTPVPDKDKEIIPEVPDGDEEKYLSCKIAVLKYRVVSQDVSLGGDNSQQ